MLRGASGERSDTAAGSTPGWVRRFAIRSGLTKAHPHELAWLNAEISDPGTRRVWAASSAVVFLVCFSAGWLVVAPAHPAGLVGAGVGVIVAWGATGTWTGGMRQRRAARLHGLNGPPSLMGRLSPASYSVVTLTVVVMALAAIVVGGRAAIRAPDVTVTACELTADGAHASVQIEPRGLLPRPAHLEWVDAGTGEVIAASRLPTGLTTYTVTLHRVDPATGPVECRVRSS